MTDTVDVPLYMTRNGFAPAAELAEMRDSRSVRKVPFAVFGAKGEAWLITRQEDVRAGLGDHTRFSNNPDILGARPLPPGLTREEANRMRKGNILFLDPPEHGQVRRLLMSEFTQRRMRRLEERIGVIVEEHLDQLERLGPGADLVANFALPIPSLVICELLGVPYADRADFQARSARQMNALLPVEERIALNREGQAYMHSLVTKARANPGEDLIGMLVREHGATVDDDMLVNIASLLLLAGHETTANMLGIGTYALLTHPDQLAWLRANPDRMDNAVEELMRFLTVVAAGVPRIAVRDVELHGQRIPAGDIVVFVLASANRDPGQLDRPDELLLDRPPRPHLAFGHGAHHCLGAPLARSEMRAAFSGLLRRFPGLALAVPPEQIRFQPHQAVYGVAELPITW
ncbi:cytochrome P450 [Crossiella sp. CA-258035]|uniref:cytochrome P450 n=1 Tax=Crossiella sp. CA-258035 TaxID=2981138 RepID=UPI0024BC7E25|nr:cytochrome P450 [Crossiella sp. CA-258035]WHT16692.1 cytochrome P450 [Crossiella sp. CA-258035]